MALQPVKKAGNVIFMPNAAGDGFDRVQVNWTVEAVDDVTGEANAEIGQRSHTVEYNLGDAKQSLPNILKPLIQARLDVVNDPAV